MHRPPVLLGTNALHSQTFRRVTALAMSISLSGCGAGNFFFGGGPDTSVGQTAAPPTVFGYAVADEPQAALVARQVLQAGGNAADAAAAAGFALSVTLPSRAGLGGGGACVMKIPDAQGNARPTVALLFPPGAPAAAGGDRPAAVPALARGLLAMEARFGVLNYSSVIVPAERLAGGVPVSPALAADLAVVGPALLADPQAAQVFGAPGGGVLAAGSNLVQPDLATTLETLRTQGVPGFYAGALADQFIAAANTAGADLTQADLNADVPGFTRPSITKSGSDEVAFIPSTAASGTKLPASAAFAVLDAQGGVVACAVTMNNLFGTGRIAAGTGILLAASPRTNPTPLLGGAIAYNGATFRAAATGTGQDGAAVAVADAMYNALHNTPTAPVPDPGRANVISCPGGVPGGEASCTANADPRGNGLAIGGR
jgi:gamma-glutamyltranspeptidase/glutathione hydrolase